ncbi:hypothetical protein RRG08_031743 [Elysia crispata]|uniref:Uncharacterized protein n=1 Tax=Elysia crispata TaxID=231223 RepID=A0AAE1DFR3_9GAST|nr:hypothetical protein RRG08_031743 [Elysia crispata]
MCECALVRGSTEVVQRLRMSLESKMLRFIQLRSDGTCELEALVAIRQSNRLKDWQRYRYRFDSRDQRRKNWRSHLNASSSLLNVGGPY